MCRAIDVTGPDPSIVEAMSLAQLAALQNLGVPATQLCSNHTIDPSPSCVVHAQAAALQAECIADMTWRSEPPKSETVHCSIHNKDLCVTQSVDLDAQNTYDFTNGPFAECKEILNGNGDVFDMECPPGDFTVIVGSWVNYDRNSSAGHTTHTVDCRVQYGAIPIVEVSGRAPHLDRTFFTKSTSSLIPEFDPDNESEDSEFLLSVYYIAMWRLKYVGGFQTANSPFNFSNHGGFFEGGLDVFPMLLLTSESSS